MEALQAAIKMASCSVFRSNVTETSKISAEEAEQVNTSALPRKTEERHKNDR